MKKIYKLILYSILILIISTIVITYWYISNHLLSDLAEISTQSIIEISIEIGLVGALIPTISFILIYIAVKMIRNKLIMAFIIITLTVLFFLTIYMFILYMTFHEFNTPIQFIPNNL